MIRLQLLGAPRLAGDRASERRRVLSQPRRVALLAYLALRAAHGPARRDTLLGMFWPESSADHARGALRNALHFLRGGFGPGAIQPAPETRALADAHLTFESLVDHARPYERCTRARTAA